jgi:hypothetical protein
LRAVRKHGTEIATNHKSDNAGFSFARPCNYEEGSGSILASGYQQSQLGNSSSGPTPSVSDLSFQNFTNLQTANRLYEVDPFRFDTLRHPTVDVTIRTEVLRALGSIEVANAVFAAYFNTIYHRLPILSHKRFDDRVHTVFDDTANAGYCALCFCIQLLNEQPSASSSESMQTSQYVKVKSILSLLEATSYLSLEIVQCRVLVAFYELGHAIYPAASMSIATAAKFARLLRLHTSCIEAVEHVPDSIDSEERKRVWWAVVNLDR